jgi:hypothetical protein
MEVSGLPHICGLDAGARMATELLERLGHMHSALDILRVAAQVHVRH